MSEKTPLIQLADCYCYCQRGGFNWSV